MKLLSLDTSTKETGWAIYENEFLVKSGVINMNHLKDEENRINVMCKSILQMLHREDPDVVAIEQLVVNRNMKTVRALCRVIDVAYFYTLLRNKSLYEVTPSEWRAYVGLQQYKRTRMSYKERAVDFVKNTFDKETVNDNEAEAICIGAAYVNQYLSIGKYYYNDEEEN